MQTSFTHKDLKSIERTFDRIGTACEALVTATHMNVDIKNLRFIVSELRLVSDLCASEDVQMRQAGISRMLNLIQINEWHLSVEGSGSALCGAMLHSYLKESFHAKSW